MFATFIISINSSISSINSNNIYPNNSNYINNEINNSCNEKSFFERKCDNCLLNIYNIYDNLTTNIIYKYEYDYINEIQNNIHINPINHYINNNFNYSITIFYAWYCTNLLLKYGYFEINPILIFDEINSKFTKKKDLIFVYINKMYNSYVEIFDIYEKSLINIQTFCP